MKAGRQAGDADADLAVEFILSRGDDRKLLAAAGVHGFVLVDDLHLEIGPRLAHGELVFVVVAAEAADVGDADQVVALGRGRERNARIAAQLACVIIIVFVVECVLRQAVGDERFAGLVRLLDEQGYDVSVSRSEARIDEESLLVLTPQQGADGNAIAEIIPQRRYVGPTMLILPKWVTFPAAMAGDSDAPQGWVVLAGVDEPDWIKSIENLEDVTPAAGEHSRWEGLGLSGRLPDPDSGLALLESTVATKKSTSVLPLITDEDGDLLAGYLNDDGAYEVLDDWSGYSPSDDPDEDIWPVIIVAEPDLLNNYGLADRGRAEAAVKLIDASLDGYDLPIVFDLTVAGLGESENLMTLAFRPPFLAATLCLLFAALVIAWRAFRREQ